MLKLLKEQSSKRKIDREQGEKSFRVVNLRDSSHIYYKRSNFVDEKVLKKVHSGILAAFTRFVRQQRLYTLLDLFVTITLTLIFLPLIHIKQCSYKHQRTPQ